MGPATREEVELALRRCWQPVARVEDLQHGPQRAVLLGESRSPCVLTESGEAAVVSDRCPHRGASLSMGAVRGEGIQCPYHGWEWAAGTERCVRIPSLADQGQIPPAARVPAFPVREQWGLVWTALEEPLGEPPNLPWFDVDAVAMGPRHPVRAAGVLRRDDRELPRRRPFRLRASGHARRDPRSGRAVDAGARWGRGRPCAARWSSVRGQRPSTARRRSSTSTRSPRTSPRPGCSPPRANVAYCTSRGRSARRVGPLLGSGARRGLRRGGS